MENLQIGDVRQFTGSNKIFKIREILNEPNIKLDWTWDSGICPHCKKRITRDVKHEFYRIEILGDNDIEDINLSANDLKLLGFTLDKRLMLLPKDKEKDVLNKSKEFKHLA